MISLVLVVAIGCSSGPSRHWHEVEGNAFAVPGGSVSVTALLAGQFPQPWLAVGWQADSHGLASPLGWSSPDGSHWSRDGIRPASFDGPLDRLAGLARRQGVAVTAGETQSATEGNLRPSMWHRDSDGAWHEVPAPRELFGGPRGGGLTAVAATTGGFVVAGGWTGLDGHFDIGAWTSADGTSWTPLDGQPNLLSVQQVVAVPAGFVATGIGVDGAAASWRSADGRNWRSTGRLPAARGVTLTSAAADGASVIAGGVAVAVSGCGDQPTMVAAGEP